MLYQNRYRYSNLVFCELYVIFSYAKNSCDNIQQHVAKQIAVTTFSLQQMMNRKHLKYTHLDVLHVLKYMTSQHLKSAAAVTQAIFPPLFLFAVQKCGKFQWWKATVYGLLSYDSEVMTHEGRIYGFKTKPQWSLTETYCYVLLLKCAPQRPINAYGSSSLFIHSTFRLTYTVLLVNYMQLFWIKMSANHNHIPRFIMYVILEYEYMHRTCTIAVMYSYQKYAKQTASTTHTTWKWRPAAAWYSYSVSQQSLHV